MPAEKSAETTDQILTPLRIEAQQLLNDVFSNLNKVPTLPAPVGRPLVFFPNGIELIYLKVEAYLTEKIHGLVEVRIAGEKAPKTLEVEPAAKIPVLTA